VVLLAFYGFAVFALTRDYYVRNPPRLAASPTAVQASPHATPEQRPKTFIQQEVLSGGGAGAPVPTGNDPDQLNRAGDELFAEKRFAEAIPYYRRVLEIVPDDPDASNDLGLALHYAGRTGEAVQVLRTGSARSPDFQRIWLTLGFVSASAGDEVTARAALEKAREMNSNNAVGQEAGRLLGRLPGP
jgi:predicted Zn-dependent protease